MTAAIVTRLIRLGVPSPLAVRVAVPLIALAVVGAPAVAARSGEAPEGAPHIVVVLLDDVGFGAAGPFGGPIPTPSLEALAAGGLRYNRFHTTAICSPTRASLLTGRNSHAVGVGAVLNSATNQPGYRGVLRESAASVAELLRQRGYGTSMWGKWHLTPDWEASPSGPFDRWPTGVGFERFYGFLGGETHQFEPTLYEGTTPVRRPDVADYHVTEDIADRAVAWMRLQHSLRPDEPFFVYFAPGATHAPLHVPRPWIDRFAGQFDRGWDALREETFARQKRLGVIPANARLTPRPPKLPAWQDLSPEQQKIAARLMETYAGFLAHTDAQVGKLVSALQDLGEFDNTLFFYIVGDNGASAEGGPFGGLNYMGGLMGVREDPKAVLARLDEIGGPSSYPQYPAGWAWAMDTPFQWVKTIASHLGGTRNPLVVSWPRRIRDAGGLRSQVSHVNDIVPTILEAVGIEAPARVNGVKQQPMDGTSLVYSFDDAAAKSRHRTQYFEIFGNRAIYHDGWMASAARGRVPWQILSPVGRPFEEDPWELYDLRQDFSQARDLAQAHPEKLRELQALFLEEARKNDVLPLHDSDARGEGLPNLASGRSRFTYFPGAIGIPESGAPGIQNRSHSITAEIDVPASGAEGVLVTEGGSVAGWSLYVDRDARPVYTYNFFGSARYTIVGNDRLPSGEHSVRFDFAYDGGGLGRGGSGTLLVDGEVVGRGRIERTTPAFFSIDETFDVGTDTGSPAGEYPPHYAFTGGIRRVTLELK
ncbi:MAG: arylsulfatase [Deltaproteobacteria bacterium]|nr:arylsulfatase [Deltaproteobacteria bacterium]MBW2361526.1 arylsulfatase [Deltaproteobacteria bacterium]